MTLSCSPESQKPKRLSVGSLTKYCRSSAKQVENWSKMPKKTLWRWLEKLEKARRISLVSYLIPVKSEDTITNHVDKLVKRGVIDNTKNLVLLRSEHGRETTLYDLKVFNYLVMRLDTDQAWEKKAKFNMTAT